MKRYSMLAATLVYLAFTSCSKSNDVSFGAYNLTGKWAMDQIYGNDYWGGPAYWHTTDADVQVRFTANGEYYRKEFYEDTMQLIGHFKIQADSSFLVVPVHPLVYDPNHPESSNYTLYYSFEKDGALILGIFNYENRVKEKYSIAK